MTREDCERCNGSGEIAVSVYTLKYRGPGPVPDDARGVVGGNCGDCNGRGWIGGDDEDGEEE